MLSESIDRSGDTNQNRFSTWRERWFAGVGRTGLLIVVVVALINALRRTINFVFEPWFDWWQLLEAFGTGWVIGMLVLLAVALALNRVPRQGPRQYAAVAVAVGIAVAVGVLVLWAWESDGTFELDESMKRVGVATMLFSSWLRYSLMALLVTGAWLYARAEAEHQATLRQCAVDATRMDQQTFEARLQMLEAQIEPHFLFNTLAHVKRLYATDPGSGERMLDNLMDYLAVALPQMRDAESTLGRELDHAIAYLNIQQIRMGRRLTFERDVPAALREVRMPPLMIVTLVENAIKHGLSPRPGGGRIVITASSQSGRLQVQVADNGQGFTKSSGGGTGLANIRARLAALFGDDARLSLSVNAPSGVTATITLPYRSDSKVRGAA